MLQKSLNFIALRYIELFEQRAARRQSIQAYRRKFTSAEVIAIMKVVGDDKRWNKEEQHRTVVNMRANMLRSAGNRRLRPM